MNMVAFHNFSIKIVNILLSLSKKLLNINWLYHLSLNQTAAKFSIPNTGTISTWEKLYRSYGFSGLLAKKRGRPSMKKSKSKNKVNKPKKELSYVEKLEQENY